MNSKNPPHDLLERAMRRTGRVIELFPGRHKTTTATALSSAHTGNPRATVADPLKPYRVFFLGSSIRDDVTCEMRLDWSDLVKFAVSCGCRQGWFVVDQEGSELALQEFFEDRVKGGLAR